MVELIKHPSIQVHVRKRFELLGRVVDEKPETGHCCSLTDSKDSSSTFSSMATSRHEERNPNVGPQRRTSQASEESHDADFPRAEDYILDEEEGGERQASL